MLHQSWKERLGVIHPISFPNLKMTRKKMGEAPGSSYCMEVSDEFHILRQKESYAGAGVQDVLLMHL